mmetsp:Transcript_8880/g.14409  ORF Transcript_8880/g.14409 Transcript_8880/m.14409 type:complete len:80 (+) Transcript_8880:340-579(+)
MLLMLQTYRCFNLVSQQSSTFPALLLKHNNLKHSMSLCETIYRFSHMLLLLATAPTTIQTTLMQHSQSEDVHPRVSWKP